MKQWLRYLKRGVHALSKHRPALAMTELEKALRFCPVENGSTMCRTMYYLGIALKRLGYGESALKTWIAGARIVKSGNCSRISRRFSNAYGMLRQATQELDDWNAFYGIQYSRYVREKPMKRVVSQVEKDMVRDLIYQYWLAVKCRSNIDTLSPAEKIQLFRRTDIIFPFLFLPDRSYKEQRLIPVRFATGRRISLDGICFCGSGRPYLRCCGRTPSAEEVENGLF